MDNYLIVIVGGAMLVLVLGILSSISQLRNDVYRMNLTLERIAKQLGVGEIDTNSVDSEIKALIIEGKLIKAIKRHRLITGSGLKEAKEYVDLLNESMK